MASLRASGGTRKKQRADTVGNHHDVSTSKSLKHDTSATEKPSSTGTPTKSKQPKSNVKTPTKSKDGTVDSTMIRNADRSARRKSGRKLMERSAARDISDDEELGLEEDLAQRILNEEAGDDDGVDGNGQSEEEDEEEEQEEEGVQEDEEGSKPKNNNKPTKKPRGRPKGWRKPRTPTPPPDLPAYEHYFFQNRTGGIKTSDNTLSSTSLISHEDYFAKISAYKDPHESEQDFLHALHGRSFDQWIFEIEQGFSVCVYGWGSKRELLHDFATHLSDCDPERKIVIVNGYNTLLSLRDILNSLSSVIPALSDIKLPAQPTDAATTILQALGASPPANSLVLLVNTIDGPALRRPAAQSLLGYLVASPHISLLASADTPHFTLLWDATLATQFNWLFHDTTTFQQYDVEISGGGQSSVVDEVNALLGRSGRKLQGREGVMYVLKSLTANARNLYALLISEVIALADADDADGDAEADDEEEEQYGGFIGSAADGGDMDDADEAFETALNQEQRHRSTGKRSARYRRTTGGGGSAGINAAIEYHSLYTKAVAQLITTNEVNYRALLKEFYDHEMVVSRRDAMGAEILGVPFRREEMELLLGELTGGV